MNSTEQIESLYWRRRTETSPAVVRAAGTVQTLERRQTIPGELGQVFKFFGEAANLELITPPDLRFQILTPRPIAMEVGTLIDYRITLYGFPVRWRTRIDDWNPPYSFTDTQLKGPYRVWVHHHSFREVAGGTEMVDHVTFQLPRMGPAAPLGRSIVARQLDGIFDYRARTVANLFSGKPGS